MDDITLVKVAKLGTAVVEVALNGDRTVARALEIAKCNPEGQEVRLDGELVDNDTELSDGDIITVTPKVKGGKS